MEKVRVRLPNGCPCEMTTEQAHEYITSGDFMEGDYRVLLPNDTILAMTRKGIEEYLGM